MNSFKSACSFAKRAPLSFDELEEDVEPLLGREIRVELVVSRIGFLKTVEHLDDAFHRSNSTTVIQTVLDHRFHRTLR
jgi:hypothetical protein